MKKNVIATRAIIHLPNSIRTIAREEMTQEFRIAERKWRLRLTPEQREVIMGHSLNQLIGKVTTTFRSDLDLDSAQVIILINSDEAKDVHLGHGHRFLGEDRTVVREHKFFVETSEPTKDALLYSQLAAYAERELRTWVRTAVFYGVGSLATGV